MKSPRRKALGALIIEAVVASFLMVFAFAAATQLFDASIRWENNGTNVRLASIVAERRMEELRRWADEYFRDHSFDDAGGWPSQIGRAPDPITPEMEVEVQANLLTYTPNPSFNPAVVPGQLVPPGFYSPASHFFTDTTAAPPNGGNFQFHPVWRTYPYVRNVSESLRRVEVTVFYGADGTREFTLMSVIGDPVKRSHNPQIRITGPTRILAGETVTYNVQVTRNGAPVTDPTALWTVEPELTTASVVITPQDACARSVQVRRTNLTPAGSGANLVLAVKIRYAGEEIVGYSNPIGCP